MQVLTYGTPYFDDLETWQKSLLLDPLVEVIKDFYKSETNRQAYQNWLAQGKPMPSLANKKEVQYEQTKMSI